MKSWLPWRYLLRRAARSRGFIDPFEFLARLRQFSQPSEVQEPIELIRAGVVFHARGLINTKVIQNNLDWVWPYWVARQFDPGDDSFLPRAFSFSHVNLTHRNWSAVGVPGMETFPIVDPRGMVTPREDRWSLDWWFLPDEGEAFYPSQTKDAKQVLSFERGLEVITTTGREGLELESRAWVEIDSQGRPVLKLRAKTTTDKGGRLVLAVRPANSEGIAFIDEIKRTDDGRLAAGTAEPIQLDPLPAAWLFSTFEEGDISACLRDSVTREKLPGTPTFHVKCAAGLATAAVVYPVFAREPSVVNASMPLVAEKVAPPVTVSWNDALAGTPTLEAPQPDWIFLHESALRTLVLLSPGEIYPGPYTYRRFWFRDACLIMNSLIAMNLHDRARRSLEKFPARQRHDGYFHSQEGEWDANGQVLWIADRLERTTGTLLPAAMVRSLERGAQWIGRKRRKSQGGRHSGLLPPGFSAEHLGPNDYYYWDDFWGIAGLKAMAAMCERRGDIAGAARHTSEATAFWADVRNSLSALPQSVALSGIPASPYRRMDAGAIGSLVADYPLHLDEVGLRNFLGTAGWLWENSRHDGGFFQDIIHSGVNAYLTLALAQTFLRQGDPRYLGLVESVAKHASSTGHWPEAIHPRTGGGCMGDGQHAWAAAEWLLMMRALFVREESDHLVVGAGIPADWFTKSERFSYGPTGTVWGAVSVLFTRRDGHWLVKIDGKWIGQPPRVRLEVPGFEAVWAQPTRWETPLMSKI
ncbi:MAG: hypothetical protein QM760_15300 [Nibricoccus sp.]